jgi:hypothetical protein
MIQLSCATFGHNLDFKPYGAAKVPTPAPQCPKCHFVLFEDMFLQEDILRLKKLVTQNDILDAEPDIPEYFYLVKELELLERDFDEANILLRDTDLTKKASINTLLKYQGKLIKAHDTVVQYLILFYFPLGEKNEKVSFKSCDLYHIYWNNL